MIPCKPVIRKLALTYLLLLSFSGLSLFAQDGKAIFLSKCASCHNPTKDGTGPMLKGVRDNEFYGGDIKKIANWMYHTGTLTNTEKRYIDLKAKFGSVMTQFDATQVP